MIPSKFRLPHDRIAFVARSFRKQTIDGIAVSGAASDTPYPRFAFVVPKSVSKLAVHRNRMRRLLGEAARTLPDGAFAGYDFVVFAKRDFSGSSSGGVGKTLVELLNRVSR